MYPSKLYLLCYGPFYLRKRGLHDLKRVKLCWTITVNQHLLLETFVQLYNILFINSIVQTKYACSRCSCFDINVTMQCFYFQSNVLVFTQVHHNVAKPVAICCKAALELTRNFTIRYIVRYNMT